ncbi:FG-GAP repeat protein [Povalibacter sp.]|uniref:FG-GAP repeat protein n=1 Tax=Povalibacter sp. TaxID=1962978 RepID=UPI002F416F84
MRRFREFARLRPAGVPTLLCLMTSLLLPANLPAQQSTLPIVPPGTVTERLPACYGWYCGYAVVAMHGSNAIFDGGIGILEVLSRTGPDTWTATQALVNPDEARPPQPPPRPTVQDFGSPIALDERVLLISGSSRLHPAAIYVFTRPRQVWAHAQTIDLPKPDSYYRVQIVDVVLDENTAIVFVRYHNSVRAFKQVHWYTRTTGRPFVYQGTIAPAVGNRLALSRNTMLMVDPRADGDRGAAYVFQRVGAQWTQTQKLTGSGTAPGDGFGSAVAFDGNLIAISAPDQPNPADPQVPGAVYTFVRNSGTWVEDSVLAPEPVTDPDDWQSTRFGQHVALSGSRLLVDSGRYAGRPEVPQPVILYERHSNRWQPRAQLGCLGITEVALAGSAAILTYYDPIRPTPQVKPYLLPALGGTPPPADSTCEGIAGRVRE